jgi:hypothetical protein
LHTRAVLLHFQHWQTERKFCLRASCFFVVLFSSSFPKFKVIQDGPAL